MEDRGETFRSLLLRHRARTGLIQREFAVRAGVSRGSVQGWESGVTYPTAARLQALIRVLLEAGGLTPGQEASEAHELWAAAEREAPRMHTPLDAGWFAGLLAVNTAPAPAQGAHTLEPAPAPDQRSQAIKRAHDWGEAPDTVGFVDRVLEVALLRRWVLEERCRLVAVLGMGGIGKTSLTSRVAQDVAPSFERVYWRSLRDAPPPGELLAGAIGFLSDQQLVPSVAESERIAEFMQLLRTRRCLIVLDDSEALFEAGQRAGTYRAGMAGYSRLFEAVGGGAHQSCLVLTSREAPSFLSAGGGSVRTFELGGLGSDEAQVLLAPKQLLGTSEHWGELNERVGGNGLALKVVGESIRELFGGQIASFLAEADASGVFGGIRRLLAEQVDRSSPLEQQVLRVLAVEREPVRLSVLLNSLGARAGRGAVLEAIEALRRRSLVERTETPGAAAFTLQSVVLEYVTDRLVEMVADEVTSGRPVVLVEQPIMQAQARDYVRQSQERLIGASIVHQLRARHDDSGAEQRLLALLWGWRKTPIAQQGHGPGNAVNLLRILRGDLRGLDLSGLDIRQAYLAEVEAQDASLAGAVLSDTVLAEAFDFPGAVALSADASLLAAGTSTGQVLLWQVTSRALLWAVRGHTGAVWGVALSADGALLATGGEDGVVRLWDTDTGQAVATLQGHTGTVWDVALSSEGRLLASGGADGCVRLWGVPDGQQIAVLRAHVGGVWGVALSADGRLVASGGADATVRLWEAGTGQPLGILRRHSGGVRGVALSADGKLVASGSWDGSARTWDVATQQPLATMDEPGGVWGVALSAHGHDMAVGGGDGTLRLWEASTGRPVSTLGGHIGTVRSVAFSADGQVLASAGFDGTVRLWQASAARPLATLQGHTGAIWAVALAADGQLVASGGGDGAVRLWDASTGRVLGTLHGHVGAVWAIALADDGQLVASGGADGTVRLWKSSTGRLVATLQGQTSGVWGVALSADGRLVASGGVDGTVRLWETRTGQSLATLHGHTSLVRDVALSKDGQLLASGGLDGRIRVWDTATRQPRAAPDGHAGGVWAVALSASGDLLASGGEDGMLRLWETGSGRLITTLHGHAGTVWRVALSTDGQVLASGSTDGMVRLWEVGTGRPVATLEGHTGAVRSVAISADGQLVAIGSLEGTVRLWDGNGASSVRTLRAERRYERMDITGLSGVTSAQRAALLALGAVEYADHAG
jgi:WD40 repeat protein/transcriptional regulator with XRE-family HTH domain